MKKRLLALAASFVTVSSFFLFRTPMKTEAACFSVIKYNPTSCMEQETCTRFSFGCDINSILENVLGENGILRETSCQNFRNFQIIDLSPQNDFDVCKDFECVNDSDCQKYYTDQNIFEPESPTVSEPVENTAQPTAPTPQKDSEGEPESGQQDQSQPQKDSESEPESGQQDQSQPQKDSESKPESGQQDQSQPQKDSESVHPYVLRVLELVNNERARSGLKPVTLNTEVTKAAQKRAMETITSFSHTRPNGTSCFTALKELNISYRGAGENIAYGQRTPEEVMNGWMNSPGHRANILNPNFTQIGIGYVASRGVNYWTQMFIY